jgi:hypothetical protein
MRMSDGRLHPQFPTLVHLDGHKKWEKSMSIIQICTYGIPIIASFSTLFKTRVTLPNISIGYTKRILVFLVTANDLF